jgi:chromosome segregation ATPase
VTDTNPFEAFQQALAATEARYRAAESARDSAVRDLAHLRSEQAKRDREHTEALKAAESARDEALKTARSAQQQLGQHRADRKALGAVFDDRIAVAERLRDEAQARAKQARLELEQRDRERYQDEQDHEHDRRADAARIDELQSELVGARFRFDEARKVALSNANLYEHEQQQRARAEADAARAEREVADLVARVAELEGEPVRLQEMQTELALATRDLRAVRQENARLTTEAAALRTEVKKAQASLHEAKMTADIHTVENTYQAKRRAEKLQDANHVLAAQVAEYRVQLRDARHETERTRRAMLEHSGRVSS